MQYISTWGADHFTQKLLGTYERELAAILEEICSRDYAQSWMWVQPQDTMHAVWPDEFRRPG
jgi:hypothetical protein